jgi:cytidylate kinase
MGLQIAIDGPAGAGKSTIARQLARRVGALYLDTGVMYRAVGYYMLKQGINCHDEAAVSAHLGDVNLAIRYEDAEQRIVLNGEDVTPFMRTNEVSQAASDVSVHPVVRLKLVEMQRQIAEENDVVLDGRDIGTFVLPNAPYKFYLTADSRERAARRVAELAQKGEVVPLETMVQEIEARDYQDMNREFAPLKKADDAIEIDTTAMSIEEVLEAFLSHMGDLL